MDLLCNRRFKQRKTQEDIRDMQITGEKHRVLE